MDQKTKIYDDIVQISRLAMLGKGDDVQKYLARARRRYKDSEPELYEQLGALLREAPTRSTPIRKKGIPDIPVDTETRLPLLQFELSPHPDRELVLPGEVHAELAALVSERQNSQKLIEVGLEPAKSALFVGPPGVGKTLSAKWLAESLGLPLLTLDLSAVMSSFLGKTGNNIRSVLDYAKDAPCVLLLDEIDAIAKRRDDGGDVGELKRLVTVILQEIDRWPSSGLMIAATNHEDLLDPAIWRRFDYVVNFPAPETEQIVQLLKSRLSRDDPALRKWDEVLAQCFAGDSYSEIDRALDRYRRSCILGAEPPEDALMGMIRTKLGKLDKSAKLSLARRLVSRGGLTQRKISSLTGLSRSTIRKHTSEAGG